MRPKSFPLEKIFGSRTRVKVITLFTTGISRPYYVREIARAVDERLNAVRRELEILQKIGLLSSYNKKRRKYYTANQDFALFDDLANIMKKAGPRLDDSLFKNVDRLGDIRYLCVSGLFTGATDSPTDLLLIGKIDETKLEVFARRVESQIGHEITYTPITENEYRYRSNFNDTFLRQIFSQPHKVIIDRLSAPVQPRPTTKRETTSVA